MRASSASTKTSSAHSSEIDHPEQRVHRARQCGTQPRGNPGSSSGSPSSPKTSSTQPSRSRSGTSVSAARNALESTRRAESASRIARGSSVTLRSNRAKAARFEALARPSLEKECARRPTRSAARRDESRGRAQCLPWVAVLARLPRSLPLADPARPSECGLRVRVARAPAPRRRCRVVRRAKRGCCPKCCSEARSALSLRGMSWPTSDHARSFMDESCPTSRDKWEGSTRSSPGTLWPATGNAWTTWHASSARPHSPISGFADDLEGDPVIWHDAAKGHDTVEAIRQRIERDWVTRDLDLASGSGRARPRTLARGRATTSASRYPSLSGRRHRVRWRWLGGPARSSDQSTKSSSTDADSGGARQPAPNFFRICRLFDARDLLGSEGEPSRLEEGRRSPASPVRRLREGNR